MNKKNVTTWSTRQGDCFLTKVAELDTPDVEKKFGKEIKRDNGRIVLAYGEVTGHSHQISDSDKAVKFFEASEKSVADLGNRILQVLSPVTLRHDEHGPHTIPPGVYEVRIQKEYTPQGLRNVAD